MDFVKKFLMDVGMVDSEEKRWLIISKYNEYKQKDPNVKLSKIHNHLRFNGYPELKYNFVYRTITRYKRTNTASNSPRVVKKRKIDENVKQSVIKHATNKKKPKYMRSIRKTAQIPHGKRNNKRKISPTSVFTILKSANKKYKRTKRVPLMTPHHKRMKKMWASQHKGDSVDDWMGTLAVDETHYETFHKQNRQNSGSWVDESEEAEREQTVKHPGRVSASTGVCGHGSAGVDLYTDNFNQTKFSDTHLKTKSYQQCLNFTVKDC